MIQTKSHLTVESTTWLRLAGSQVIMAQYWLCFQCPETRLRGLHR